MTSDRTAWLRARQRYVMATDIPRLCGVYFDGADGAANVYREKLAATPIESEPDMRMRLGLMLEPFVADLFTEQTGIRLAKRTENYGIIVHRDEAWIGATTDRICVDRDADYEGKVVFGTPDEEWGDDGSDQVPDKVFLQKQWQLCAGGFERGYVCCLFAPYFVRTYLIEADAELHRMLVAIASDFRGRVLERRGVEDWRHVLIEEAVERANRVDPNRIVMLSQTDLANADRFFELGKIIAAQTDERHGLKVQLMKAMGKAEFGLLPDGSKLKRSRTRDLLTRQTRKAKR